MAKKKPKYTAPGVTTVPLSGGPLTSVTGVPITLNGNSYSSWSISPNMAGGAGQILSFTPTPILLTNIKDLRSHLFKVEIGDYDTAIITSLIRGVEFLDEKLVVTFFLDDKDTIREAFSEYHFFRLSYLNTKGEAEETYEIKTDPIVEPKYILPNVRNDSSDIPNWKLVWSPYTVTKI